MVPSKSLDRMASSDDSTIAANRTCASSACFRSDTSVLVPNHCWTRPCASLSGITRVRKGRKTPSAPRKGKVISNGAPVAREAFQRSTTAGKACGSWTLCQPQPSICAGVVPVYSYHRRLYQVIYPSLLAHRARLGIESASVRNRSEEHTSELQSL